MKKKQGRFGYCMKCRTLSVPVEATCANCSIPKRWEEDYFSLAPKYRTKKRLGRMFDEAAKRKEEEVMERIGENIGMLRQWLNEDRITDTKRLVSNDDIKHWIFINK